MSNDGMDLSGLKRLQDVTKKLGGNHKYKFNGCGNLDLAEKEQDALTEELTKEFVGPLMGDENAQKSFLRTRSFSYRSRKLGKRITVKQVS